ncbi:uncharacterized protein BDZ99DRAFT_565677 [Mytilinidion resinicola]|uniref:Zn(2)-C6 fungal-type domain-containing protein n=1 Tax=Mytilinidion resinicola TaxID=574789 RepID=A0A6A6Z3L2_9PEZI|nr:uncharacterized protein BDZ99DRAFT_565677 [Mytilinidion resinicola]KAF2815741.1 hypothetical protein BDZ99DRAFT_565677 [Mytilinidion resinicola]
MQSTPPNSGSVNGELLDEKNQPEQAQTAAQKRQKSRHRASVACASCRDRRIRCVVPPGDSECIQCKRSGVECIIKNDDERRRPISRAYMCSLTERVALLETMLKEHGAEPPPANHPPKTRHGLPQDGDPSPQRGANKPSSNAPDNSSPGSQQDDFIDVDQLDNQDSGSHRGDEVDAPSPSSVLAPGPPRKDGMVNRLLSTRGHLSFDQLSGRLRYFGPTTNCHVHSELGNSHGSNSESSEQSRRAEKIVRSLSLDTYDYLMDIFWHHYNSVIHVLHQEAFNEDRETGRAQFYSGFLHVCVLAMGYRFADKTRPDIQRLSLPQKESTLHREAKYMLDHELERPGGIPSVVALLLLGDLECQVGRDNLGWLYAGLAVRLAFDIGLHLDTRLSGLSVREVEIRQMTLWACVIYDKYWALFLGRPTSMKSTDLEIYSLSKQFERLGTCRPAGVEKSLETQIYEALLDLMELAGKITENMDPRSQGPDAVIDRNQYLRMAALDREFSNWYARLPDTLRWTPANINAAPFSFFLLHQQYHSALILLHRPFAMYEDSQQADDEASGPDSHFSALSRTVCTKHAIRVARIFWQHRQRFDTKQIFVTGMQHAGTAATALVAALAFIKDPVDRANNMQYLECLSAALQDMACTFQPAERMSVVLQAVMLELRGESTATGQSPMNLYKPAGALVPARRGSSNDDMADPPVFKRRQTSRPRANTASSSKKLFRSQSISTMAEFKIKPPPPPSLRGGGADADAGVGDGYIMVTPRSEMSSAWPALHDSNNGGPPIDPAITTPSAASLSSSAAPRGGGGGQQNTWMGAELDSDSIVQIAGAHFPEMGLMGACESAGDASMSHLDFMALGSEDWTEWQAGVGGVGTDLDGFPPQAGFGGFEQGVVGGGGGGRGYGGLING